MTHEELVIRAEKWLKQQGCGVTLRDPFRALTANGEEPDAIGWRNGVSVLIECKVSKDDFRADKQKPFRANQDLGMGDWRFYLCPPNIIMPEDLPEGWGLLWAKPKTIRNVYGVPGNAKWMKDRPFCGCKDCENMMLASALRRLNLRGHLHEVYEGLPGNKTWC